MPVVVAAEAARAGRPVSVAAIRGITDPAIEQEAEQVTWLEWGDLPAFFALLQEWQEAGVAEAIMAGKVEQRVIYDESSGAPGFQAILEDLPTGHTDQLLGAVANILDSAGIVLLESTRYLQSAIARPGRIAGREPDDRERADVEHGWRVAKALGQLDIGQTVVVKNRAIVAVEAMEGTDACIRRAGDLAGAGCVVVKVGKPEQDLRFDVPVVGIATVESLAYAGATVLAIEADVTVVFDRPELENRCRELGIAVVADVRD
jgi:DUF1009 family protein